MTGPDTKVVRAIGDFLTRFVGPDFQIIRACGNHAAKPAPAGAEVEYAVITPMGAERLATNIRRWEDLEEGGTMEITMPTQRPVRIDFYGPRADALALTAATLLRDPSACDFLENYGIAPLHVEDPRDLSAADEREVWVRRWRITVMVQANAVITVKSEFFTQVDLRLRPQA